MTLLIPVTPTAPRYWLPILHKDLLLDWSADDLLADFDDADTVTAWAARAGSLAAGSHGAFHSSEGDWTLPALDVDGCNGQPCITLAPTGRIKTYVGQAGGGDTGLTAVSISLVARFTGAAAYQLNNSMRLVTGSNGGGLATVIRPSSANRVFWGSTSASGNSTTVPNPLGWNIWTMAHDGEQASFRVSGAADMEGAITAGQTYRGLCLGAQPHAPLPADPVAAGQGISVAAIRVWGRRIGAVDIAAQHQIWADKYGIAA